ncbi:TrkA family potassium uptake protein [Streptomyces sp. NBC_01007]|nr:TrkA family potassium uptake protein [Streptomyces sp. NBC_01007]
MKVLIGGAGRPGTQIAQVLSAAHNDVILVEQDDDRVATPATLPRVRLMAGDACDSSLLERAEASGCDLVISATGRDEGNLVISLFAKRRFEVGRVAARVNDAENAWLFDQQWGVDVAVPAATPLISLIEEATDTVALLRLSKAGVEVIETAITERSRAVGHALSEIPLPSGTIVATVVRDGRPTVPGPGVRLQQGDELLLVSHEATEQEIHAAFQ